MTPLTIPFQGTGVGERGMGRSQVQMLLISRGHPLATAQMQYFGQLRAGSTPKLPANRSNVPVLVDMGISPLLLVSPPIPYRLSSCRCALWQCQAAGLPRRGLLGTEDP